MTEIFLKKSEKEAPFKTNLILVWILHYLLLVLITMIKTSAHKGKEKYNFEIIYEWKQIEYKFKSKAERSQAIENGTFNVGKIQPLDALYTYNVHTKRERIFITTPRIDPNGVPATLSVITNETKDGNPIIDPYPSWSWQLNPEQCNYHRLVSVFRIWIDECNRLWVVDTGLKENTFICSPQILAFDLERDTLLYKYEIPYNQYNNISWYIAVMAEVEDHKHRCENTWLYLADANGPGLLVYSLKQNSSWRIEDVSFRADPKYYIYNIGGVTVNETDALFTVALSPASDGLEERKLFYHALSNVKESWVYVKHLKNQSNFKVPYGSPNLFNTYKDERSQPSATEAIDREGYVYFSLLLDVELSKWDPNTPYVRENFEIIANNKETMQWPGGLKILPYKGGICEALWVFSVAYQKHDSQTLNGNETNFRLFVAML